MRGRLAVAIAGGFVAFALGAGAAPRASERLDPVTRRVNVSVTDGQGLPVTDLSADDFTVKEGGKDREVTAAEPAKGRIHLALVCEERLTADGSIRMAMFEFVKRMADRAEIALITIGLKSNTIVNYTTAPDAVVTALGQMSLNPNPNSNISEGILELVRTFDPQKYPRSAMVLLAFSGGQAGGAQSKEVLDRLRQSGVVMSTVTLSGFEGSPTGGVGGLQDASNREKVLGEGPKQTGGRRIEIPSTGAAQKALQQIAGDLLAQYTLTYTLPEGVKPDRRLNVSVKRKGLNLRAPNMIADE